MRVDHSSVLKILHRWQVAKVEHARELSLLVVKVIVRPLLEIYAVKVRFTRKINFFKKINLLKFRIFSYARGKNYWGKYLRALRVECRLISSVATKVSTNRHGRWHRRRLGHLQADRSARCRSVSFLGRSPA